MTKFHTFQYLTDSKEVEFIANLATIDSGSISSSQDFEKEILLKLFLKSSEPNSTFYYLKNKYLYLFTEGAINFLEANKSMGNGKSNLAQLEIDLLKETITKYTTSNFKELNIISIGAGTSDTELSVLGLMSGVKFNYFAIDVSFYLLEIGVNKFKKRLENNEIKAEVEFISIVADIWKLANNINDFENLITRTKFDNGVTKTIPTIFTFFGGTIGNYPEKEVVTKIMELMKLEDILIIGYDTYLSSKKEEATSELYDKYNNIGNLQFLIQPLKYIPRYSGYLNHFNKYFKFSKDDAVLKIKENENEYEKLTDVQNSLVYAPYLKLPSSSTQEKKIRLAQSTKYGCLNFTDSSNNLTNFLNTIDSKSTKLNCQKTMGKKESNLDHLGVAVSKFQLITVTSTSATQSINV